MIDRVLEITDFIDAAGWGDARQTPCEADFSPRHFARLERADGARAILMDADLNQKTPQFVALAGALRALGISAPVIYAAVPERGLVLMEDFGDGNVGRMLDEGAEALPLFADAARLLAHLHRHFDRDSIVGVDLPVFDSRLLIEQAAMFLDSYVPFALKREATAGECEDFRAAWDAVLRPIDALPRSLILRDFMPDNLMLLPQREGWRRIGTLDFQDGGIGSIAYDLASLCEVVRRDGGDALLDDVLNVYRQETQTDLSPEDLKRAAVVLSAQRHTRILGIIARLALGGRSDKLPYLAHVQAYLKKLLQHPALSPVEKLGFL